MPIAPRVRRSRPLRCEEPEHLFFATTRTPGRSVLAPPAALFAARGRQSGSAAGGGREAVAAAHEAGARRREREPSPSRGSRLPDFEARPVEFTERYSAHALRLETKRLKYFRTYVTSFVLARFRSKEYMMFAVRSDDSQDY